MPQNSSDWRTAVPWKRLLIGSVIGLTLLWLALRTAPLDEVLAVLHSADYRFVALALLAVLTSPFLRAIRWRLLFFPDNHDLDCLQLTRIILIGQMLNILIPARIGELARIHFFARTQQRSRMLVLGSIVLEKWLDLLLLLVVSIGVLLAVPTPPWFRDTRLSMTVVTVVFLLLVLLALRYRVSISIWAERVIHRFPQRWHERLLRLVKNALTSLNVLRSARTRTHLITWSAILWILSIAVNDLVMVALRIDLPVTVAAFLLVVLNVGVAVPSAPASLGIFEIICILTLGLFGISADLALSYAILLRTVVYLPPLLLGAVSLWWATVHEQ